MGVPNSKDLVSDDGRNVDISDRDNNSPTQKCSQTSMGKATNRRRRLSVSSEVIKNHEIPAANKIVMKDLDVVSEIKASISDIFLFKSLLPEHLNEVLEAMEIREYDKGETIIKEGDDGNDFFVIADGICEVYIEGYSDDNRPVRILNKGESFGELALMYNAPRSATVVASNLSYTATKCWVLDRETFRRTILTGGQARRKKYEDFLSCVVLLQHLKPFEISQLADAVEPVSFTDGSIIIKEGDDDRNNFKFYFIESGEAHAFIFRESTEVLMSILGVGEFFGEKALIEKTPRTATIKAHGELKCASLSIAAFERLMGPCSELLNERALTWYHSVEDVHSGRAAPITPHSLTRDTTFFPAKSNHSL